MSEENVPATEENMKDELAKAVIGTIVGFVASYAAKHVYDIAKQAIVERQASLPEG